MTSCPICLEDIFLPNPNSNSEASNGNSKKENYNIGVTVPCGHLYHYDCFDSWRASQTASRSSRNHNIKCPTCNTKTKDFTRLYLDVTTITGSYCHLAGNGEDDISLSSVDEDDNDSVSEDYTEENKKNHQNDISVIAQQSADVDHGEEVVVDLTSSPSSGRQQQQKSSSSSRISHRGDSHDDLKTEHQRLKRIAKKFKRQFLQKNVQYKEQYDEKKKISEKFRQTEKEMSEMKDGVDKMKRDQQMTNLHFNESRLSLLRTLTELDLLKSQKSTLEKEKSKLDSQMKNCHSYYENELEKARTKSMSEVQQILEDHPKVVEENRKLKQQLQRQALRQKLHIGDASSNRNNINNKSSKDITKALRQMDYQVRSTMPSSISTSNNRIKNKLIHNSNSAVPKKKNEGSSSRNDTNRNNNNATSLFKVSSGQYSSLASRMMTASSSSSRPKKILPQNAFVKEMLSSGSRDSNKKNKMSDSSNKRPASFVTASKNMNVTTRTSLNFSQSKRMKSTSDARRGIFQRKNS